MLSVYSPEMRKQKQRDINALHVILVHQQKNKTFLQQYSNTVETKSDHKDEISKIKVVFPVESAEKIQRQ